MASGHANRANGPNTWLHRPSRKREESPCQRGAVHTWHICDKPTRPACVRFSLLTGHLFARQPRRSSVESRCDAVALGRTYLFPPLSSGGASIVQPWLRFHTPLIEPDMQISRIRLSDKTSRLCFRVRRHLQFLNT